MNAHLAKLDEHVQGARLHAHHKVKKGEPHDRPLPGSRKTKGTADIIPRDFICAHWLAANEAQNVPSKVRINTPADQNPGNLQHMADDAIADYQPLGNDEEETDRQSVSPAPSLRSTGLFNNIDPSLQ